MLPTRISHYELLEELGAGGMGIVYKANDLKLGRTVALKFLPPQMTGDSSARHRFLREARAASAIDHPNICTIHEVDETPDGRVFLAMALYDGQTLRSRIAGGPLAPAEAQEIAAAVASGLSKAHRAGIIHRDIKPANIMITSDSVVKILDFGLAKLSQMTEVTKAGTIVGSPPYMSPEQVRGDAVDHRTDIWSLGVVMYEIVTGTLPFRGDSDRVVFHAILDREPTFPPGEPARSRLLAIASRCLQKNPENRYSSCDALIDDLRGDAARTDVRSRPESKASIAVLPFADMSPERDQTYFCEGVAEEILNSLTRVEGLQVASRTSSFQFKGAAEDIRRIGERLNVRSILEGSVRKAGDRLRITVQLINVGDGYHLWSERYDRKLEDVFAIQDEIAEATARALKVVLSRQEEPLRRAKQTDVEAYEFYLRGRQIMQEYTTRSLQQARKMFEQAIAIDPKYALAHTGAADASSWLVMWSGGGRSDLEQAERASQRALELAPDLAESSISRGLVLMLGRRYDEAEKHFRRAIALNPRSFDAHYFFGRSLFASNRMQESEEMLRRAAELRPEDFQALGIVAMILRNAGQLDEVRKVSVETMNRIDRWLDINPRDPRALYLGALRLRELGRDEEGRGWIERALAIAPDDPFTLYNSACFYSLLGERDRALDLLEKMTQTDQASTSRDWMLHDPDLDALRSLPRFKAVLDRLP
jgi:serine/threonine protein kinase/Flp pilus assembly protein TadD